MRMEKIDTACKLTNLKKSFSRCAERDIASLGRDSSCYSGVGVTQRATPIAVVAVIGGFTHKRGERVNSAFY